MSRNNRGKTPKLDLRLNLSPGNSSRAIVEGSPNRSSSSLSSLSSCVSSETERCSNNSPEATSMVLAGCPRCLMYVMLSEEEPKCPRCKSPVLLDFHQESNTTKKTHKS